MIRLATQEDIRALDSIYLDDEVWPLISDDFTMWTKRPIASRILSFKDSTLLTDGNLIAFWLRHLTNVMYEVHTACLPEGRGKYAVECAEEAIDWIFKRTYCRKIISFIPATNKPAVIFALQCGFKKEGVIKNSFLSNGKLIDQLIVGRSAICQ